MSTTLILPLAPPYPHAGGSFLSNYFYSQNTDPHSQLISYNVFFWYGKRKPDSLRLQKRWQPLVPLLMDHIMVDIDPEIEDTYVGTVETSNGMPSVPVPIEAKLRTMGVKFLYEICKMQSFSLQDLRELFII